MHRRGSCYSTAAMTKHFAFDRRPPGTMMASTAHSLRTRKGLALDRASVRTYRKDGQLDIAITNISKAAVNPYLGHEIPEYEALGLQPEKIYQLFRDPAELEKAAPTSNRIPVLTEHVAVTADDHQPDLVVGSTGSDAVFAAPFLRNSLVLWARDGIDAVESGDQKELSCAYHYRADMTPGVFEGKSFDGVMRDIVFNHVALVEEGRAGADVVVGDSMETVLMKSKSVALSRTAAISLGALAVFLAPKLAQDHKLDITPLLQGLTAKNFKSKKDELKTGIAKITEGKLAQDADLEGLVALLDKLEGVSTDAEPAALDPNAALPMLGAGPDDDQVVDAQPDAAKEFLKGKLSAEDMAAYDELCAKKPGATDESPEDKAKREEKEKAEAAAKDEKDKDMVTKPAMDAAIKLAVDSAVKATREAARALRDAEDAVRPYVGKLAMAHDSADEVYRTALGALGVNGVDKIDPSAYPALLAAQPKPGAAPLKKEIAMDAASEKSFAERFPGVDRIGVV